MVYNLLFFSGVKTEVVGGVIEVTPQFKCPNCEREVADQKVVVSDAEMVDFNRRVTFTLPCCNVSLELYVAVHKGLDGNVLSCISTEPNIVDWWMVLEG
jgi:hypothetical protein